MDKASIANLQKIADNTNIDSRIKVNDTTAPLFVMKDVAPSGAGPRSVSPCYLSYQIKSHPISKYPTSFLIFLS